MPRFEQEKHSTHAPEKLFAVVADIAMYPKFLPWCVGARILSGNPDPFAGGEVLAELAIRFGLIQESYVSRVRFLPPTATETTARILTQLERGPFTHLTNEWHITPAANGGSTVYCLVDFGFRVQFLEKAIGGVFGKATQKMSEAFEARVQSLYPTKG
jgi:coenzyme Q-binding protein COQ10